MGSKQYPQGLAVTRNETLPVGLLPLYARNPMSTPFSGPYEDRGETEQNLS